MKNKFEVSAASWQQVPARVDRMGWSATMVVACLCAVAYFFFNAHVLGALASQIFDWFNPLFKQVTFEHGHAQSKVLIWAVAWVVGTACAFVPLPLIALLTRDQFKMMFIEALCLAPILAVVLWRGLPETMSGWVVAMQPMGAFLLFVALVFKTKP